MKKLLVLAFILISTNAFATPNNSMSITTPNSGETISASDETTRYNEVTGKFNAHSHTDIDQVDNTLKLGDGNSGNKTIQANNGDANLPFLRFDDTNNIWVVSTDGTNIKSLITMSGTDTTQSILPQTPSDNDFLMYDLSVDRWLATGAIDTINIDGGTIDGVTLGGSAQVTVTDADMNGSTVDGTIIGGSSTAAGSFTALTSTVLFLRDQTVTPITAATKGGVYIRDTELYYREKAAGTEVQLTADGVAVGSCLVYSNDGTFNNGNNTVVYVSMVAGGGGGGGAGGAAADAGVGGGEAGGHIIYHPVAVTASTSYTITSGDGGPGANDGNGTAGGQSCFDTLCCNGGNGGTGGSGSAGGTGQTVLSSTGVGSSGASGGAGGTRVYACVDGADGGAGQSTTNGTGGGGGGTPWGPGAAGGVNDNSGANAVSAGSGGGGGGDNSSVSTSGGNGADGVVMVCT
jgi:hypothetical protein